MVGQIVFHCAAAGEAGLSPAGQIVFHCAAASGITHWVTCLRRLKNLRFLRISRTLTRVMLVWGAAQSDQPGSDLWFG